MRCGMMRKGWECDWHFNGLEERTLYFVPVDCQQVVGQWRIHLLRDS